MAITSPSSATPDDEATDLLPKDLVTVWAGEDGHLYLGEGDSRSPTRLTWSPEDFSVFPGLPALPGTMGDLEDALVFAHPTPDRDGRRIALFGLLPTMDEGMDEAEFLATVWPLPGAANDDVVGPSLVLEGDDEDDEDDEDPPRYWPGGKVYVVDRGGVEVTQAYEFDDGSPTHLEWAPDDRHLLVLHQDEGALQLHLVDSESPGDSRLLAAGAPVFWSWQPKGDRMAARVVLPGEPATICIGQPLQDGALEPVAEAGTFYVPAWHPDGTSLLFATAGSREDELILADHRGRRLSRLLAFPGRAAFQWAADGRHIALAVALEVERAFGVLELLDVAGDRTTPLFQGAFVAFDWLPGERGLVVCGADEDEGLLRWIHVDLEGHARPLGSPWSPSRESLVALHFFEQVAPSHPHVSADGRFLLHSGWPESPILTAAPFEPTDEDEGDPAHVLVTPFDDGPTVSLGPGRFGCFLNAR